ncbi:MAG: hypothetical protein J6D07_02955 [Mogibacterium sp.]|nr:hypothetical protein [Mogibacterium sp.]
MYYRQSLEDIKKQLEEKQADLIREMKELPEGSLLVYEKRGRNYYCQRLKKEGNRKKERRIAITNNPEMIFALTRKRYIESALDILDKDIDVLEQTITDYVPADETSVMVNFISKYPELERGIHFGKGDPEAWTANHIPAQDLYSEDLKSISQAGEKMRSGAEMYIASRLDHFGMPYKYEASTGIPDISYIPDFTIMRPRDRKIIYWEHLGKINDREYVQNNIHKLSVYIEYGICPWDNLILTYNNNSGGFDGRLIDSMINGWLL